MSSSPSSIHPCALSIHLHLSSGNYISSISLSFIHPLSLYCHLFNFINLRSCFSTGTPFFWSSRSFSFDLAIGFRLYIMELILVNFLHVYYDFREGFSCNASCTAELY